MHAVLIPNGPCIASESETLLVLQYHRERLEGRNLGNDRARRIVLVLRVAHVADIAEIGFGVGQVVHVERDFRFLVINAEPQISQ